MRIGVFDSGIGGITVLTALRDRFPSAEFVYLGDTANVPYGGKSAAHIQKLSSSCARILKSRKVDALVVACNTASSLALPAIRKVMGRIPVFGVLEPGVDAVRRALESQGGKSARPILVLATRATVNSHAYGTAIRLSFKKRPGGAKSVGRQTVIEQACPLLVPLIEEGWIEHPVMAITIAEYVAEAISKNSNGIALLGCTHYPWIQEAFERALPGWTVVNSAQAVADTLAELLGNDIVGSNNRRREGRMREWIFTDPDSIPPFAKEFVRRGTRLDRGRGKIKKMRLK